MTKSDKIWCDHMVKGIFREKGLQESVLRLLHTSECKAEYIASKCKDFATVTLTPPRSKYWTLRVTFL